MSTYAYIPNMAEQRLAELFEGLSGAIGNLANNVSAQGVGTKIEVYSGEPKGFKDWIKSIEKHALLTNANGTQTKRIAFQTSRGAVSDFIHRYITANPNNTWDQLKDELSARFSEIQDSQHAFTLLRQVKQSRTETVQVYAEKLYALAQEAFSTQQGGLAAVENQMIGFFTDGLYHDFLKMKVMRDNPTTFQNAVTVAMNEQNLRQRFNLRSSSDASIRKEEPMEIGHLRPKKCYKCQKPGHTAKNCRSVGTHQHRGHVNAINEVKGNHGYQARPSYQPRPSFQPRLCFKCNSPDHLKRDWPLIKGKVQKSEN